MPITSDDDIHVLSDVETIAVVDCSATAGKPAHDILMYMQRHGYRVVPVNPFHDEVLGETTYDSLVDVDEDVDLADVSRPSEETGDIIDAAIEHAADRGDVGVVWLQLDIRDDDVVVRVEEAGLSLVQDKCFKAGHSRFA